MQLTWTLHLDHESVRFDKVIPRLGNFYDLKIIGGAVGTIYTFYVMDSTGNVGLARSTYSNGSYQIAFNTKALRDSFDGQWRESRMFHVLVHDGTNICADGYMPIMWDPTPCESGEIITMQGPKGDKGDQGDDAYQVAVSAGFVGSKEAWLASIKGQDGTNGTDGTDGVDGKSAYELAVEHGFTGTEEEWLNSIMALAGSLNGAVASVRYIYCDRTGKWHRVQIKQNILGQYTLGVSSEGVDLADDDTVLAYLGKNQTFTGLKTFSQIPVILTAADGDESTKAASTQFVQGAARFDIVTKSIADNVYCQDRAVNIINAMSYGSTPWTLQMPTKVGNKGRNFTVVLTVADNNGATMNLAGGTFYGTSTNTFRLNGGAGNRHVIVFTEIGANVFMVSHRCFNQAGTKFEVIH